MAEVKRIAEPRPVFASAEPRSRTLAMRGTVKVRGYPEGITGVCRRLISSVS